MKMRIFFLLFLFPLMVYCQYYVGRLSNYSQLEIYYTGYLKTAINADGSIYAYYSGNLKKLTANGTPDLSFGNNGVINNIFPATSNNSISVNNQHIFLSSDNKIAKYDLAGTPDLSFGINGVVTLPQNIYRIFANDDSSVYFTSNNQLSKLLPDGQIDSSFAVNSNTSLFYVIGNNIYVFHHQYPSTNTITKYDLNGVQDMTYGNGGALVLQVGDIIDKASGDIYAQRSTGVTKYTSAGVPDNTFGTGGTVSGIFPGSIMNVVSDSNNNILFFGGDQGYGFNKTVIFRLKSNGEPDNTFNNGSYSYTSGEAMINDVRLIDDNTYICIDSKRYGLGGSNDRTNKYVRTMDSSIITVDPTLNVADVNNSKVDKLQIYPNPAIDYITIKDNSAEKILEVSIFTMAGELVISGNERKIDIKNLPAGSYILEIRYEKNKYISKFIKK